MRCTGDSLGAVVPTGQGVQVRSGGGAWTTVASVRANTAGHVTSTFTATQADAVRILAPAGNGNTYSRIVELEAYGS